MLLLKRLSGDLIGESEQQPTCSMECHSCIIVILACLLPAFETDGAYASIIADGIHVDYSMISIAKKLMKERLFLITDAVEENLSGTYLHVRQNDRFTLPDGTLSGSRLTMMKAVKNCVEHVSIPVDEALRMASSYPAEVMKIPDKGRIAPGCKADLVVFDKNFNIEQVFVEGVKV